MRRLTILLLLLPAIFSMSARTFARSSSQAPAPASALTQARMISDTTGLSSVLNEYFVALRSLPVSAQEEEADFIIGTCKDSLVRQFAAIKIYSHYLTSEIMGDEAVAIYLTDNWFVPGKVCFKSDLDLMNAKIFADFNRQSLIGEKAPSLRMSDNRGDSLDVSFGSGRPVILYFYEADCAKCKLETPLLTSYLSSFRIPVDFYAVYTGSQKTKWETFVKSELTVKSSSVRVFHLWDETFSSGFQVKYGVLQTPRLFLVDGKGVIRGRGLDVKALKQLIEEPSVPDDYVYGSEESMESFDRIALTSENSVKGILSTPSYIRERTLAVGDTLSYKHLIGDYLYWLALQRGEVYKEASAEFIDQFIFNGVWKTSGDSLKVLGYAGMMKDMLSRTPVGSRVPDIVVPGVLLKPRASLSGHGSSPKSFKLRKLRGEPLYLVFYSESCHLCRSQLSAIDSLNSNGGKARFLLVDADQIALDDPKTSRLLLDTFDLSALPYIIAIDRKGVIRRKYISF